MNKFFAVVFLFCSTILFSQSLTKSDLMKYNDYSLYGSTSEFYFETIAYPEFKKFRTATGYDSTRLNKVYLEKELIVYDIDMLKIDSAGKITPDDGFFLYFKMDNKTKMFTFVKMISKGNNYVTSDEGSLHLFLTFLYTGILK